MEPSADSRRVLLLLNLGHALDHMGILIFPTAVLAMGDAFDRSYGELLTLSLGGFIAFGLCFMIIALLVKKIGVGWIDVLFPPAAMGAIVAIIGLELAPLAMTMSGFIGEPQGMSAATSITISMFTLIVTILATVLGRGFISIIPILIGVIAGYILSVFMGVVDFTHVEEMPWFALPTFYAPHFNLSAIMMILPALFVVLAEHIGHLFVTSDIVGHETASTLRERSLAIYQKGSEHARTKGIIIADTKFEFGVCDGEIILIDEVMTPDSSRFWPMDQYAPGRGQPSFDKQFVRDWLESTTWDKNSPPPALPPEVVTHTRSKYIEAYERLSGLTFEWK